MFSNVGHVELFSWKYEDTTRSQCGAESSLVIVSLVVHKTHKMEVGSDDVCWTISLCVSEWLPHRSSFVDIIYRVVVVELKIRSPSLTHRYDTEEQIDEVNDCVCVFDNDKSEGISITSSRHRNRFIPRSVDCTEFVYK